MALKSRGFSGIDSDDKGLRGFANMASEIPMLSLEVEQELATAWRDRRDQKAFDKLVASHLRLVIHIASKYRNYGLPMSDLIQEGNIGLMKAVEKFDLSKGFRLSTYAMWWIKAGLTSYIMDNWSMISLPRTADSKKLFFRLARTKASLGEYGPGDMPADTVAAIAKDLEVSAESVVDMNRRLYMPISSLDKPIGNDDSESDSFGSTLPDEAASPEESYGDSEEIALRRALLHKAIEQLDARERDIVERRFFKEESETLAEVAEGYKVSRERIRQIEERALKKISISVADMVKRKWVPENMPMTANDTGMSRAA